MNAKLLTKEKIKALFPARNKNANKGDFGRVAIVGGSSEFAGSVFLAGSAALRGGAGYTALFVPEELLSAFYLKLPEAILYPSSAGKELCFEEKYFEKLLSYDAIAFGMGAKNTDETLAAVQYLVSTYTGKLLLDADALNALSRLSGGEKRALFSHRECDVLITPHPKEFARLTGKTVEEIVQNPVDAAIAFSWDYGVSVLLKGSSSVIASGKKTAINEAGTPAQAKGGSGDLLSGLCASLMATGLPVFDAACAGAFLAGTAAELAVKETGENALLASDVVQKIGAATLKIQEK